MTFEGRGRVAEVSLDGLDRMLVEALDRLARWSERPVGRCPST
jgi:hypothetical protein